MVVPQFLIQIPPKAPRTSVIPMPPTRNRRTVCLIESLKVSKIPFGDASIPRRLPQLFPMQDDAHIDSTVSI